METETKREKNDRTAGAKTNSANLNNIVCHARAGQIAVVMVFYTIYMLYVTLCIRSYIII